MISPGTRLRGWDVLTSRHAATIFLTGSSGFVGSSLQRSLVDWQVVSVARGEPIPSGDSSQPAIVVHAAWPAGDTASWAPFRDWSLRLRTSAAERGAWFVGLGSGLEAHAAHPGLKEPYSSYALRKLELRERLVEMDPERFAWIRLHFMFGPGERPYRIIPSAIRAALKGEEFVCGSLDRKRRWLHVDDQAHYLARFLEAPQSGACDIAGQQDVSFRDLLTLVEDAVGRNLRFRESDEPAPDSEISAILPQRMSPFVPTDAGTLDTLAKRLRAYAERMADESTRG
jgi:nucleoside-diphosphate-sugar epimerase